MKLARELTDTSGDSRGLGDRVPNSLPMPAVTAIASALQKVTRSAPTAMLARRARAASPLSSARNTSDVAATQGSVRPVDGWLRRAAAALPRGEARVAERERAPAAACPQPLRTAELVTCVGAPSASCAVSCSATLPRERGLEAARDVDRGQLAQLALVVVPELARARARGRPASLSACEMHRHAFARRHRHRAATRGRRRRRSAPRPASRSPRATPSTRLAVDDDAVVRAEDGGAQPAGAVLSMRFMMATIWHAMSGNARASDVPVRRHALRQLSATRSKTARACATAPASCSSPRLCCSR